MNTKWQFADYETVFDALRDAKSDSIVVGGQACNFYSARFLGQCENLKVFVPFTSHDLDVQVTDVAKARDAARRLGAELKIAPRDVASPVIAAMELKRSDEQTQFVQFMRGAYGVKGDDVIESALTFDVNGSALKVMHPILLLESKIACLKGLDQTDRQDEKHAKMAICFSACFINNIVEEVSHGQLSPSVAFAAAEHVHRVARSDAGLHAWRHYGLSSELALPLEAFQTCRNEKFHLFMERRLPQLASLLDSAKEKIAMRVDAKHLNRFPDARPELKSVSSEPLISPPCPDSSGRSLF